MYSPDVNTNLRPWLIPMTGGFAGAALAGGVAASARPAGKQPRPENR